MLKFIVFNESSNPKRMIKHSKGVIMFHREVGSNQGKFFDRKMTKKRCGNSLGCAIVGCNTQGLISVLNQWRQVLEHLD